MNHTPDQPAVASASYLSQRGIAVGLPVVVTLILFVVGISAGGESMDRGLQVLAIFLAAVLLTMAIATAVACGVKCAYSLKRWVIGQAAALCMGLGAGYVGSSSAFGAGFGWFIAGLMLAAFLLVKELETRSQRRLAS